MKKYFSLTHRKLSSMISKYDSISKYQHLDVTEIPMISQVKVRLTSEDVVAATNFSSAKKDNEMVVKQIVNILAVATGKIAKIKLISNKIKSGQILDNESKNYICEAVLKSTKKDQDCLEDFLELINYSDHYFADQLTAEEGQKIIQQKGYRYIKVNLNTIPALKIFISDKYSDIDIEKINFHVTFIYKTKSLSSKNVFPISAEHDIIQFIENRKNAPVETLEGNLILNDE